MTTPLRLRDLGVTLPAAPAVRSVPTPPAPPASPEAVSQPPAPPAKPTLTWPRKRWPCDDVLWFVPGRKTPIAGSTRATSDIIGLLAQDGLTFRQARAALLWDSDGQGILDLYIARGHGDTGMAEFGVR